MTSKDTKHIFAINLSYALIAQFISLLLSVIMSLIVPKLLGVQQFSYWQLFIFYTGYVGFFHLGLPDGIYLRYGGVDMEDMDKSLLGSQLRVMSFMHICISAVLILAILFCPMESDRKFVWCITALYMIITNALWFLGFVFQAANKTKDYSIATIISKVSFLICVVGLMFIKLDSFRIYGLLYVIAQGLALVYCLVKGREFVCSKQLGIITTLNEMFTNAQIGINLTISNLASSFILGVGRILIDRTHGISSFGYVSLAISLTNFFLQFISQVSMVMFPMLRQLKEEEAKKIFVLLRSGISFLLCSMMLLYVPVKVVLCLWLPQYEISLDYLAILLPICVFDGKMQLLYNTYLKVLRKERVLLLINLISLLVSFLLCSVGVFVLNNLQSVVLSMVISIAFRSVITSIYLSHIMLIEKDISIMWELILSTVFIVTNMVFSLYIAFAMYLVAYVIYCMINRKQLKTCLNTINLVRKGAYK